MLFALLADLVVSVHLLFIVFVVAGGLLVLRVPSLAWIHLPCLLWSLFVFLSGSVCPLTPLEVDLRLAAGQASYTGTFIAHYIEPIIYPPGLTRAHQIGFGLLVLALNAGVYLRLVLRSRHKPMRDLPHG